MGNPRSAACAVIALVLLPGYVGAQDSAADAAEAAGEVMEIAELASLAGTSEGLYRGCKASVEMRTGRPSEPRITMALQLSEECESYARGVAHAVNVSTPFLAGSSTCRVDGLMEPKRFVDAVVAAVQKNPLLIGQRTTDQTLTFEVLKSISTCARRAR